MSGSAAFSRLQLAAALLEYDNDPDDPNAPYRSAQDSAIFAHFRRNPAARPEPTSHRPDYLGVSVPSDAGSLGGRESALEARRSRGSRSSMDGLRNPFGADHNSESEDDDRDEQAIEVDLASWGLDAFIPKEKSKSAKSKGKQPISPPITSTRSHRPSTNHDSAPLPRSGIVTSRPLSAGGNLDFTSEHIPVRASDRRRSFGSPLDLVGMEPTGPLLQRRRVLSQASIPPHSMRVPFPSSSVRSQSPGVDQSYGDPRSRLHERTLSMASMGSRLIYDDTNQEHIQRERSSSIGVGLQNIAEDNPFAIHHPSHISRFDPKVLARTRTHSNISMGSRMVLENDNVSVLTGRDVHSREPRYSTTMDLLRPKVLVMPSPLQPVSSSMSEQPTQKVRDGFELSTDGPPLPPGARSSRRLSSTSIMETEAVPLASNSFIPNPHVDLSLSQKTFRDTLVVGGKSGAYLDTEVGLPRATEDGEQIQVEDAPKEDILPLATTPEDYKALRPAGKLYGKSLIDDLENRKANMRSKQRVFTGDERPSMMAREHRASTLIDPASLQTRPTSKRLSSYGSSKSQQALGRQNSLTMKPLLNFEDEDNKALRPPAVADRMATSRSVFGVDTLWEREMVKLKEIEAREAREKEERLKEEEETERKKTKRKHKRKDKHRKVDEDMQHVSVDARVSVEPPTLPDIRRATRNVPPKANHFSDGSSESEEEAEQPQHSEITPAWHENSSDDEDAGPRRTTGVGLRYPQYSHKISTSHDNDSEEDLPLAATIHKAAARAALGVTRAGQDSDDEGQPLSRMLQAKANMSPPRSTFYSKNQAAEDDDDQPLGLRTSRFVQSRPNADDEDDLPLAFHPEQQRRTQYQMLAQQQMMMQAQMQSTMLMNASMMGPGYFAPLVHPMGMMQVPVPMPSPPPIHDEAKFGRVDRWRRDIVVDE